MKEVTKITFILLLSITSISAQSKLEADFGGGLIEALSLKVKYGNNFQLGICQGFLGKPLWMSGVECYYHFSGYSKHSDQRTFYIMGGLASTIISKGYRRFEKIFIYPRIGKTYNYSKRIGLNLDIGLGLFMADDIDGYHSMILPSGGIHIFLRI